MTETPQEGPQSSTVGPLAQEAALLLDVFAEKLTAMKRPASATRHGEPGPVTGSAGGPADAATRTGADHPGSAAAGPPPADEHPGPALTADGRCPECGSVPGASCTACPVCRFLAVLRGERPEATARLVDGALLIIRTLRTMVADPVEPPDGGSTARSPADSAGQPHAGQPHAGHHHAGHHNAGPARPYGEPTGHPPTRRGGLEHIDIS